MTMKPSYEELERRVQELEKIEYKYKSSREALQKSENLFKLLYEKAPLGYQSLDENGHFIVVNQTWLDSLGYTREEVIGKSFADFLHPDWRDHFKENFPRFKSIGEIQGVDFEMVKKDGDLILVSFTGKISRDEKGNFQQTHCIFHDITDRKRMEKALRESEEKYRILFEHTGEALFVAQDARIVFQNPRSTELLGYSEEEFQSKPFFDFIHEDDREMVTDHHIRRLRGEKLPERYNFRIIHKNGSILWAELNAVLFQWNGRPAVLCFMTDITKRKQIEDGLIESEALFRGMFKGHSAVMLLIDPNTGRIIMANQAAAQYYGYPLEKMLQMKIQQLNVLSPAEITKKMGSAFTKQVNSFEFQHMLADGQVRDVEVHSAPITIQHQTLLFSIIRDITERNQAEATLRESEERIRTIGDNLQGAQLYQLRVAPDGGTMFTYVSSKVEELHECKPEEVLKDASLLFKRVHPADVDEWQKRTHKSLRELTTYDHTVRIVRKSGEIRWHRMISKPRKLDDGSVLFDGVELDVTERKQAQEALQESLMRYDELVANVPVGVYVFWIRATGHLEFEYVSDRWCEIHQVKREYVLSDATRVNNLVHPDDQDDFLVRNQESFLKRIPFAWEGRFLIGDGDFRWLRIESTPIVFDNCDIRWFGLTWDITDRKQAEEALRESNKTAHQFFSESSAGAFFMMLDEPVEWNDSVDKEKVLDYVFDHQRITKINRAMLDHYLASEKDFLCMTPKQLFAHDLEHGRLLWRNSA
jgi:PAS domain S-box-containing protein